MENLHIDADAKKAMTTAYSKLVENNPTAAHLSPLQPVKINDLKDWIRDVGVRNPEDIQQIIDTMAKGLSPAQQEMLKEKEIMNMANIERLQEVVFKIANEDKSK